MNSLPFNTVEKNGYKLQMGLVAKTNAPRNFEEIEIIGIFWLYLPFQSTRYG